MCRLKFMALAVLLASVAAISAQSGKTTIQKKPDEPAPVVVIVKGQLPRGWKALGLTDKQKKEVYKVRASYAARIAKLTDEITALRLKEKDDTEAVLTDAQRSQLKIRRGK